MLAAFLTLMMMVGPMLMALFSLIDFIIVFLARRLFLLILGFWDGGSYRFIAANGVALVTLCLANGYFTNIFELGVQNGLIVYGPSQAFWLLIDLWRFHRPGHQLDGTDGNSPFVPARRAVITIPLLALGFGTLVTIQALNWHLVQGSEMAVPDRDAVIRLQRKQTHPFLGEYDRELVVLRDGRKIGRYRMSHDTGGTSHFHVYRMGEKAVRLVDRFSIYDIDLLTGQISETDVPDTGPVGGKLLGEFNDVRGPKREYRFIPLSERPVEPIQFWT